MRKILSIFAALAVACTLGACSNSTETTGSTNISTAVVQKNNQDKEPITDIVEETIPIDPPYVAIDNDDIKITFDSVSTEINNKGQEDAEYTTFSVNFTLENKTKDLEADPTIAIGYAYIGDNSVEFSSPSGQVLPGKTNSTLSSSISKSTNEGNNWITKQKGTEYLNSAKDLLKFNGIMKVNMWKLDGSGVEKKYTVPFDLSEYAE